MNRKNHRDDILAVLLGSVLFGLSMDLFLTPCGVILGGASGVAMTLHRLTSLPVGTGILLVNLPLLLASVWLCGWRGVARTVIGVLTTSAATDALAFLPAATADPLLGAAFGGACMGAAGAFMLPRGYTTGGSDLAAYLITYRARRLKMGTVILLIDAVIVVGSAVLTGNFAGIVHSAAAIGAYSLTVDAVISGLGRSKLSIIISERHKAISAAIAQTLKRGVTLLPAQGYFTGQGRTVILCVVKRTQLYALKELVRETDPQAFIIISDAAQVMGHGFSGQ